MVPSEGVQILSESAYLLKGDVTNGSDDLFIDRHIGLVL